MQRHPLLLLSLAWSSLIMAQTAWPPLCIQSEDWPTGTHHTAVTQPIEAPCSPTAPLSSGGTADVEFVSGTEVHLMDGFHAGDFTGDGHFHAYIDDALGGPADLVLIAPEPATHVQDNMVHVEKWEKLEVGLRLPQDYLNAIDSFFVHYYSNSTNNTATPGNVDTAHDLNPYADDSLQLVMTLTSPSGVQKMKWGFYMREAHWPGTDQFARLAADTANPLDRYRIRFRFAPDEEGPWHFSLAVRAPHTRTMADVPLSPLDASGYAFVCDPPLADNHGYLHVNPVNHRVLQFEDGTSFFGMGTNMCDIRHAYIPASVTAGLWGAWYRYFQRDRKVMMQTMRQLHAVGGNYLRMAFRRETSAFEWVNAGVYDSYHSTPPCNNGSGISDTANGQYFAWEFDRMLDSARFNDLYIQLNIEGTPPGSGGETNGWGNHPYVRNFLYPHRDPGTGQFDMKRFFFTPDSAGNPQYDAGVFYYWKRKYKYLLSRWGYSVNIAALEPFNEIELYLGYADQPMDSSSCIESLGFWPKDTALPALIDHWYAKIAEYIRGEQVPEELATSPLEDSTKLLLVSYALSDPLMPGGQVSSLYRHFANPNIDLMDAHQYAYTDSTEINEPDAHMKVHATHVQAFRDSFPTPNAPLSARKPFIAGETNYWSTMQFGAGTNSWNDQIEKVFHNYDVSFHNELWSGAFSGKFATGLSWLWERVFWWDGSLPAAPVDDDVQTGNLWQQVFTDTLGGTNLLDIGVNGGHPVVNKPIQHNFKPLSDMLNNPNLRDSEFFNGNFTPLKIYDDSGHVESYYLMREGGTMAIGWVHNLNAWTMNNFYLAKSNQNFLGCSSPVAQTVSLQGFAQDHDFYITYFPTRMNASVLPNDTLVASTLDGIVTLDLSDVPLNGISSNYLDTLHSDYAFVIAPFQVSRSMLVTDGSDSATVASDWDFSMFPNPANDVLHILVPASVFTKEFTLFDLSGRCVYNKMVLPAESLDIPITNLAKGTYGVRVSDAMNSKVKVLVIH